MIDPAILSRSLLPRNATLAERAIENAMRADIDFSEVGNLWNPATCPIAALPFLAWGLAISRWDANWSEAEKRAAVAQAIPFHRKKGTRAAVEEVLARFHPLLEIVEWWEVMPNRTPHTFEVRAPAGLIDASFLTADVANAIIRDVATAKPLRSHFEFVQSLEAQAGLFLSGCATISNLIRIDLEAFHDPDPRWGSYLLTEDGEPITGEDGEFLEI